jgi:hypothetical protein
MLSNGTIMEGMYSRPEFENIKWWSITEKVDGMNIRIEYDDTDPCYGESLRYAGRTDKAELPRELEDHLARRFKLGDFRLNFPNARSVTLFGEGYGPGIQKGGGLYRGDKGFILFDVFVDGWWLNRESVEDIAKQFYIDCVPLFGVMYEEQAINYVKMKSQSIVADQNRAIEGIVARSAPLMLFRNGKPVMWKLKLADYDQLRKRGTNDT